jgi:hypothetical protein
MFSIGHFQASAVLLLYIIFINSLHQVTAGFLPISFAIPFSPLELWFFNLEFIFMSASVIFIYSFLILFPHWFIPKSDQSHNLLSRSFRRLRRWLALLVSIKACSI